MKKGQIDFLLFVLCLQSGFSNFQERLFDFDRKEGFGNEFGGRITVRQAPGPKRSKMQECAIVLQECTTVLQDQKLRKGWCTAVHPANAWVHGRASLKHDRVSYLSSRFKRFNLYKGAFSFFLAGDLFLLEC